MRRSRKISITAALAAVAVGAIALAGCSSGSPSGGSSAPTGPTRIAFLVGSSEATFVAAEREGITETLEAAGYQVDSQVADYDPGRQQTQCDQIVSSGDYAGIIIQPASGPAATPCVTKAAAAGIPVIAINAQIGPQTVSETVQVDGLTGQVYDDQVVLTRAAAQLALQACADAASCVMGMVTGDPAYPDLATVRATWAEEVAKNPRLTIAGEVVGGFSDPAGGVSATQNLLQANPGINLLVVDDDETAAGVVQEVQRQGKGDSVRVIGVGGTAGALQRIQDGTQFGSIAYPARLEGVAAAQMLLKAIKGEPIADNSIDSTTVAPGGTVIVTAGNVQAYLPGY